jgi:replicative DNA helicase
MEPTIPTATEAENAVLGSLIIDQDAIYRVKSILEPGDFFVAINGQIYEAILHLYGEDAPVDMVTLRTELDRRGVVVKDSDLTAFINATPTSVHAEYYAEQVRHTKAQRDAIDCGTKLVQRAYSANGDLLDITAETRAALSYVEGLIARRGGCIGLDTSLDEYLTLLEYRGEHKDDPKLRLPWSDFKNVSLMPGFMISILAEPGVGKTAFMECCSEGWAKEGWHSVFFHNEYPVQVMKDRQMCRQTGIPLEVLEDGAGDQLPDVVQATLRIGGWPGYITYVHCPGWTMGQIVAEAQRINDRRRVDVVILDYFNKVRLAWRPGMNSTEARDEALEDFKTYLEVNHCVGLIAAQFDKSSRQGGGRKTLKDAKGTTAVEDKSQIGLVIDRPYDDIVGELSANATVDIVKGNMAKMRTVKMYFDGPRFLFQLVARTGEVGQ